MIEGSAEPIKNQLVDGWFSIVKKHDTRTQKVKKILYLYQIFDGIGTVYPTDTAIGRPLLAWRGNLLIGW